MHVGEEVVQIKQDHFYCDNDECVCEILTMDPSPFTFELENNAIPIDVRYGSKYRTITVDGLCTVERLKRYFEKVGLGCCYDLQANSSYFTV